MEPVFTDNVQVIKSLTRTMDEGPTHDRIDAASGFPNTVNEMEPGVSGTPVAKEAPTTKLDVCVMGENTENWNTEPPELLDKLDSPLPPIE